LPAVQTRFRRSPHIVSYWSGGTLVFHNFATGHRVAGSALTIGLLDYFDEWRSAAPLLARSTIPSGQIKAALRKLVRVSMLHASNSRLPATETAMARWSDWNPAAGFFHDATKDTRYERNPKKVLAFLRARLRSRPVPPKTKTYAGVDKVTLPPVPARGVFSQVLLSRRTWRRFGTAPMSTTAFSALMDLTFRAQQFLDLGAFGPAMLRTSPSAGACNPLEAYVIVRRVTGVPTGIYHYAPLKHELARVNNARRGVIERHLPGQSWYGEASFVVLMTAIFGRAGWKYPFPRAYRTVLLEAGHFCQTFCLAATALGLAPFCSAALADSTIERDLGIDGVNESVVYACGAGTRPPSVDAAPWPKRQPRRRASRR